jgi:hypothetical protein
MSTKHVLQVIFWVGLTSLWGCGPALRPGVRVSGLVTADDSPLDEGLITFIPLNGTAGQKCSALIRDGKYVFEPDQGLMTGEYRVEVMGLPPGVKALAEGKAPTHSPSTYREIAPAFNEASTLKCTLEATGENSADFNVKYVH